MNRLLRWEIDPEILDDAGIIAYDDSLSIDERERRLMVLAIVRPDLIGSVQGYFEMCSMLRSAHEHEERWWRRFWRGLT